MATNDFAITNTLLQSLFGPSAEQQAQAYERSRDSQAMQMAQLTPGRGSVFAAGQTAQDLEQRAGQLGGAIRRGVFGIETPKEIEDKAVEKIKAQAQPLLQQGDMAGYADFLAQEYAKVGLTERAARAKAAGDQFRLKQAELAKLRSEETKNLAQAEKAGREGRTPLADRLVALQTKANSGQELTASEAAELKALEKVVKIQAPKGTDLSGLAEVMGKEAAKEEGKALGKQLATITGKQQTVESLTDASKILENGIYTGAYSEFQSALAKKTLGVIGDRKRVENTEVFINEVNGNVIPLLKEFGGNDSNEELKFLQRLVGGDITLEENSIRRILASAIKKINRGIKRLEAEKQGIAGGKKPQQPAETPSTPVATKRWNPQTNRIESISQ